MAAALVALAVLVALIGLGPARWLPLGLAAPASSLGSPLLRRLLRSPLAPEICAGLLPVAPLSAAASLSASVPSVCAPDLHVPAAAAIGLLPRILPRPGRPFVESVALPRAWRIAGFGLASGASRRLSARRTTA